MARLFTLIALAMILVTWPSFGQKVTVNWFQPEKYTDVEGANESRKRFRKRVFVQLEEHFEALSGQLPAGTELEIKVLNVNLAGDVRYNFALGQEIRLVKNIYWPMLKFEYKVKQGDRIVFEDSAKVSDSSFMNRIFGRSKNDFLNYEKQMLSRWFEKEFMPQLDEEMKRFNAVM